MECFGKAMHFAVGPIRYVRRRGLCLDPLAQPIGISGFVAEKEIALAQLISKVSAPKRS
jgi:hypothetical protein